MIPFANKGSIDFVFRPIHCIRHCAFGERVVACGERLNASFFWGSCQRRHMATPKKKRIKMSVILAFLLFMYAPVKSKCKKGFTETELILYSPVALFTYS